MMVAGLAVTVKVLAAAGLTVTVALPVMELVAVSVAVTHWLPAVFSVALKLPVPLVRVVWPGSTAWPSPLVKWTVPLYQMSTLPSVSRAVTVTVTDIPAVVLPVALTSKRAVGDATHSWLP